MSRNNTERQEAVMNILQNFQGLDPLKQLFWSELNYERLNQPVSRKGWGEIAASAVAEDPILFAAGGEDNGFHVIYTRLASDRLLLGSERSIVLKLLQNHPYSLFVFSDSDQDRWHFVNVKYDSQVSKRRLFRRITVGADERLRTASERIAMLDMSSLDAGLFKPPLLSIQQRHDEAFDVELVTKQFFKAYSEVFKELEKDLYDQKKDRKWAHDYSLQFLNRLMFIYFIQRKRWLGNDTEFLRTFWESYKKSGQQVDSFFEKWLRVLFFEAFNNNFHGGHRYFPEKIREALSHAPYLNGGLFKGNKLDEKDFKLADSRFELIFNFLEKYNFTIAEDSPLDQEVAVDPEMIGRVYESLVNTSETADEQGDAGIFYTPRTEIDLMCRLSIVDYLSNHSGDGQKNLFYELVFALDQDEKHIADAAVSSVGLWKEIQDLLCGITILDPACGSGSFLVGMLHILDDIQKRAQMQIGIKETSFERKKRIIGESLYGVDVMDWACHIAELRLWLALIIDAEFTTNELNIRQDPLLPHFTFKIRYGDSLKQEVGGINLGHTARKRVLSPKTRNRITALKHEKMKFFNNDSSCKFRTEKAIRDEELKLFDEVLDTRSKEIKEEIKSLDFKLQRPFFKQIGIDGAIPKEMPAQLKLEAQEIKNSIEKLEAEHERVSRAKDVLKSSDGIPPFVWDVSFVEIFEGEKEGFDIVIGNPPYVRQENISDPFLPREKVTAENKKEYKAKLMRSVYGAYPDYFGYDENRDNDLLKPEKAVSKKLDAKSDLYIYFYLHGLSLLNDKGSFCFITSNSWLDVGYGAELQEFLLKNCHVKMAIDNQVKRSFANADVNTVIALFSAPCRKKSSSLDKTARFIMFKVPFTYALSPVIFEEIEGADERRVTQEYRIYPVKQEKLLADGCEMPDEEDGEGVAVDKRIVGERRSLAEQGKSSRSNLLIRSAKYIGNKWGGKYLRAPDIYWTILEKGKGKLVRLGDIADVRFGIKTGANEFFYLDEDKIREWGIEKEFLKPVIKSPKECKGILINPKDLKFKIFMCHKDRKELKGTNALKYIEWGERQGFDGRPSCRGRQRWWECTEIKGNIFWVKETNDRLGAFISQEKMLCDCRLYFADGSIALQNSYNSTITALISEVLSRGGLGEGAKSLMVYEVNNILVLNPSLIKVKKFLLSDRVLKTIFTELCINPSLPIRSQTPNPLPDRRALDNVVFDILDLTPAERNEVYWAVCELVTNRLDKARSM